MSSKRRRPMDDRANFKQLLAEHKLTQAASAALICTQTGRPCSVRAVRSWLNDRDKPSSRGFPDWALTALTNALALRATAPA